MSRCVGLNVWSAYNCVKLGLGEGGGGRDSRELCGKAGCNFFIFVFEVGYNVMLTTENGALSNRSQYDQ